MSGDQTSQPSPSVATANSAELPDNAYCAVQPQLVLLAKALFQVRPSSLEAGEKRLLLTAQAIADGKREDRWGHHTAPVMERFCAFTASAGESPLPWPELLADEDDYDGKEGVAARTGNIPLGTTKRYRIDTGALSDRLTADPRSMSDCANSLGVPTAFLRAVLDGRWPSVSQPTANRLTELWGEGLITRISDAAKPAFSSPEPSAASGRRALFALSGFALAMLAAWFTWTLAPPSAAPTHEIVGYWDYDAVDGQSLARGVRLLTIPGAGLGEVWQNRLELSNHAELPARVRTLWPVTLQRDTRRVCIEYPDYPTYAAYIEFPDDADNGIYRFGPCQ